LKKIINNNSNSKNNSIKLQNKKYIPKINTDNMIKSLNIKITNNNRKKDNINRKKYNTKIRNSKSKYIKRK
jgi:hypothetical protein